MGIPCLLIHLFTVQGMICFEDRPSGTAKFFLLAIFLPLVEIEVIKEGGK